MLKVKLNFHKKKVAAASAPSSSSSSTLFSPSSATLFPSYAEETTGVKSEPIEGAENASKKPPTARDDAGEEEGKETRENTEVKEEPLDEGEARTDHKNGRKRHSSKNETIDGDGRASVSSTSAPPVPSASSNVDEVVPVSPASASSSTDDSTASSPPPPSTACEPSPTAAAAGVPPPPAPSPSPSTSFSLACSPKKGKKSIRSSISSSKTSVKPPKFAKSFHCAICRQVFHENALLRQHVLVHFKCSKCEIQFMSRADLKTHVEGVHWRMRNLCDRLDLSQSVLDASTKLYKDFHGKTKGRFVKGVRGEMLVGACLFAATRQLEMNFSAKTLCAVVKIKMGNLFKALRVMQNELDCNFALKIKLEAIESP